MTPKLTALAQADKAWQAQAAMEIAAQRGGHHDQAVALVSAVPVGPCSRSAASGSRRSTPR